MVSAASWAFWVDSGGGAGRGSVSEKGMTARERAEDLEQESRHRGDDGYIHREARCLRLVMVKDETMAVVPAPSTPDAHDSISKGTKVPTIRFSAHGLSRCCA